MIELTGISFNKCWSVSGFMRSGLHGSCCVFKILIFDFCLMVALLGNLCHPEAFTKVIEFHPTCLSSVLKSFQGYFFILASPGC